MTNRTFRRRYPALLAVTVTAIACGCFLCSNRVAAKGKPGGGGGTPPSGTIYFDLNGPVLTMDADGGAKTALPLNVFGQPSQTLHGGRRWFLDVREVPGDPYPDGGARVELFAVRDDGDELFTVQLTDDPRLEVNPRRTFSDRVNKVRWAPFSVDENTVVEDAFVSFETVEWDLAQGVANGGGIYVAPIDFDQDGNVVGLMTAPDPAQPLVSIPVHPRDPDNDGVIDDWRTRTFGFDWAPDGTALVWGEGRLEDPSVLYVVDFQAPTPESVPIAQVDLNGNPRWSPDGSRIALALIEGIATIAPDGTSLAMIVRSTGGRQTINSLGNPIWSADGGHLVYSHFEWNLNNGGSSRDLYRVTATGKGRTNLTTDIDGDPIGVQWR